MAVYLKDGAVLLDTGAVSTSSDCCCGECTECHFLFPAFNDGMGNCYSSEQCDGFHDPVPCLTKFLTDNEYCVGIDFTCDEICVVETIDPVTCEITIVEGSPEACGDCVNGTVHTFSDEAVLCLRACCHDGICSLETFFGCDALSGIWLDSETSCDPDPC